ncbi:MAG: YceI family protein [Propionivibrio sp.]
MTPPNFRTPRTPRTPRLPGLALAALLALPALGDAVEFNTVQTDHSTLTFAFKQMNVGMDGKFGKFTATLAFDPAQPDGAKASLEVDLASIDTGTDDGNDEVAGKLWFDTKAFPTARFVSTSITPLGGDRYDIIGELSIKGRTQKVSAPTTVTVEDGTATFAGAFVIKRADFAVGEGSWADFSTVANEVEIKFHVLATDGGK